MSPRPLVSTVARLVAAFVALTALVLVLPATSERASSAALQQEIAVPRLSLISQPTSVDANDSFVSFLSVTNAPTATDLVVDIYDRALGSDPLGVAPPSGPAATFPPVSLSMSPQGEATTGFSISLYTRGNANPNPAWGYRIDEPGVYPLRLRLRDAEGSTLSVMYTVLTRNPTSEDEPIEPTSVSLLIDAQNPPPTNPAERRSNTGADKALFEQLGVVLESLEAHDEIPATFSLTPDSLVRAAMDPDLQSDMGQLREVISAENRDVLDAPYVNIDPSELVSAGLPHELTYQRDAGRATLDSLLEPPLQGIWRLTSRTDSKTLNELSNQGISRVVLTEDAVRDKASLREPSQVITSESPVRTAFTGRQFALNLTSQSDPLLAVHLLLGSLASAATERTDAAQVIVSVDPTTATPETLEALLSGLETPSPWITTARLEVMLDVVATEQAKLTNPSIEDLQSYPEELQEARADLGSYSAMAQGSNELSNEFSRDLAMSAAMELPIESRLEDVRETQHRLKEPFNSINLPEGDTVTLGASEASVPVPIDSDLKIPAKVVIHLSSNDRLAFPTNPIVRTLEPGRNTINVRVRARANGDTPMEVSIRTPDDRVVLAESRYIVRSTAMSGVGLVLTIGAMAFLVVWWGRHIFRARKNSRATANTPDHANM
ncbi:MAG: hypothetical protein KDA95_03465 [Acidimicrobiales bacterium]|nr:hypothetical protein [Acidimicrobiales bacterium]